MNRLEVVEQIITCQRCELAAQCNGPVPLRGDPARLAIIGEAPGETEDRHAKPFIGPAGKLLDRLLDDAGIHEPHGIANAVSCWPHGTPTWDHIGACAPNLTAQLDYLDPRFVLLLGRVALGAIRPDIPLRRGRGRPFLIGSRIYFATYHPAAALRNSSYEDCMRTDLDTFKTLLDGDDWHNLIPDSCAACPNEPEWYEGDTGLGWCPIHLPPAQRALHDARTAQLADELAAARARASTARDAAIAAVAQAADPDWMTAAWDTLIAWLRSHDTFFVDDFWQDSGLTEPREARALGPIVMRAARDGLMRKTGEFRKSVRSNMTEKPVWQSLLRPGTQP